MGGGRWGMGLVTRRLAAVLAMAAIGAGCAPKSAPPARSVAVPVSIAQVMRKNVPVELDVIGNVEAVSTISVKSQIGGELTKVHFNEGDFVKKGDLLFTIDQRPLEAMLAQVQANLARDKAQLSQAQANLARDEAQARYAEAQVGRFSKLVAEGVISREQFDQVRADADRQGRGGAGRPCRHRERRRFGGGGYGGARRMPGCSWGTPRSGRRSTGAPAT